MAHWQQAALPLERGHPLLLSTPFALSLFVRSVVCTVGRSVGRSVRTTAMEEGTCMAVGTYGLDLTPQENLDGGGNRSAVRRMVSAGRHDVGF